MAQIMTIKRLKAVFRRCNIKRVGGDAAGVLTPAASTDLRIFLIRFLINSVKRLFRCVLAYQEADFLFQSHNTISQAIPP